MLHETTTRWVKNLAFTSEIDSHTLVMDAKADMGDDSGPSPKKLLLSSLAGCTGMDVVSLLNKMRVPFTGLTLKVSAELTDEHPKVYSEITIIYQVFGQNLDKTKVEKAVKLSKEKYCGVSAMLEKNSPIKFIIEYLET